MTGVIVFDGDEPVRQITETGGDVLVLDGARALQSAEDPVTGDLIVFDAPPPVAQSVTLPQDLLLIDDTPSTYSMAAETGEDVIVITTSGPPGPQGPPGASGGGYTHNQATPAATWTITHNLGRPVFPVIVVGAATGEAVFTDVEVLDLNTVVLTFPEPTSGYAYL